MFCLVVLLEPLHLFLERTRDVSHAEILMNPLYSITAPHHYIIPTNHSSHRPSHKHVLLHPSSRLGTLLQTRTQRLVPRTIRPIRNRGKQLDDPPTLQPTRRRTHRRQPRQGHGSRPSQIHGGTHDGNRTDHGPIRKILPVDLSGQSAQSGGLSREAHVGRVQFE